MWEFLQRINPEIAIGVGSVLSALLVGWWSLMGAIKSAQHSSDDTDVLIGSDSRKFEFESFAALRQFHLETVKEISRLVGRLISPQTEQEYDEAWYLFTQLYVGQARLVISDDVAKPLGKFFESYWDVSYADVEKKMDPESIKSREKREKLGEKLNEALRKAISKSFEVGEINLDHLPIRARQQQREGR